MITSHAMTSERQVPKSITRARLTTYIIAIEEEVSGAYRRRHDCSVVLPECPERASQGCGNI